MYTLLRRSTNGVADDIVRFARDLVKTPSPSYGEAQVAALVEREMRDGGYDQVMRDEAGNVVGVMHGRENEPTIVLASHMDTVAADCSGKWDGNPYEASIRDGRLVGLGASDCKGGIAAQVAAGTILRNAMLPLRGNLVVAATVAEENGASVGVRELLGKTLPALALEPRLVLLGEPTSLGLYHGHDGWMEIAVTVEGTGKEAVRDAARALRRDLERENAASADAAEREDALVEGPDFERIGETHRAVLRVSRRLVAAADSDRIVAQINRSAELALRDAGGVAVAVEVRENARTLYTGRQTVVRRVAQAWETSPFDPMMERARQCLGAAGCDVRPGKWQLGRLGMGTAGAVVAHEFGLPALGYGPGDEEQAHRPGECVDTNMLVEAAYGTAAIVHGIVGVPVLGWTSDEI